MAFSVPSFGSFTPASSGGLFGAPTDKSTLGFGYATTRTDHVTMMNSKLNYMARTIEELKGCLNTNQRFFQQPTETDLQKQLSDTVSRITNLEHKVINLTKFIENQNPGSNPSLKLD